ncbi:MAG: hypothetical protein Q4G51_06040 [Dermatophilus congolensis]|nr:hypothetical protein [Dermatophilus congolensis]
MRLIMPSDILAAADHVTGVVKSGVNGAVDEVNSLIELIGRASTLMDDAERLVMRANAALASAERQLAECERQLIRSGAMLDEADAMIAPLRPVVEAATPAFARAIPIVTTVVNSIEPDEVDAVVRTVNHLPALVDTVETQVIPNLAKLEQVGPDVHEILENVSDLSTALMGMPGMGWMQKRGAEKQDDDEHGHEHPSV